MNVLLRINIYECVQYTNTLILKMYTYIIYIRRRCIFVFDILYSAVDVYLKEHSVIKNIKIKIKLTQTATIQFVNKKFI